MTKTTDPVDTEVLRDMGAALTADGHQFGARINAAADEVDRLRGELVDAERATLGDWEVCREALAQRDRLRVAIDNAPHAPECEQWDLQPQTGRPLTDACTCWKADVL